MIAHYPASFAVNLECTNSFQRVFTRHVLIHNPHILYRKRCWQLRMKPLWLRRLKLNLTFVFNIPNNLIHSENSIFSHSYLLSRNLGTMKTRWSSLCIDPHSVTMSLRLNTYCFEIAFHPKSELAQIQLTPKP